MEGDVGGDLFSFTGLLDDQTAAEGRDDLQTASVDAVGAGPGWGMAEEASETVIRTIRILSNLSPLTARHLLPAGRRPARRSEGSAGLQWGHDE
ncbi:hypothetical protein [Streptomyces sp. BK79]|uniref:hypothetical protein n=1 Tax=Streptomyces sp. BK79 TaxID=3350097 RepID=UPI0037705A26